MMKRGICFSLCGALLVLLTSAGCISSKRLPSEDIEVPKVYAELISIMKDPRIPRNSQLKYETMKKLLGKVDYSFTRHVKTLEELFCPKDAVIDNPGAMSRLITFYYQYKDHSIRLSFQAYQQWIFRVDIVEK